VQAPKNLAIAVARNRQIIHLKLADDPEFKFVFALEDRQALFENKVLVHPPTTRANIAVPIYKDL
jgi:hypothetical protein